MGNLTKPAEELADSARDYVDLKVDDVKLRAVKGLSISLNRLLSMILVLGAASIAMLALAFGLILLLGNAIGNYAAGAFIVAGFFLIVTVILFIFKDKLFVDGFVRMFARIFFDDSQTEDK